MTRKTKPPATAALEQRIANLEQQVEIHRKVLLAVVDAVNKAPAPDPKRWGPAASAGMSIAAQQAQSLFDQAERNARSLRAKNAPPTKASSITRARQRIREIVQSGEHPTKRELEEKLRGEDPQLSGAGFDAAWREAAPESWKRRGRPKNKKNKKPTA